MKYFYERSVFLMMSSLFISSSFASGQTSSSSLLKIPLRISLPKLAKGIEAIVPKRESHLDSWFQKPGSKDGFRYAWSRDPMKIQAGA